MSRLTRFFAVTRVNSNSSRYDPFQAKFRRVMAVSGENQSVTTANAKGWAYNLLIDIDTFLELFNVSVGLNRRSFDRRTLLDVASVVPSGLKRRSRFPVLDVFWT